MVRKRVDGMRPRSPYAVTALVAMCLGFVLATGPALANAAPAARPLVDLAPSGNFFLAVPGPHGFVDPGSRLTVQYRVQSPTFPGTGGPGTIHVPASIVTFTTNTGTSIHLFLPVNSFTVTGPNSPSSIANDSLRLATGATFGTSNATLSSNGFAVQASWNPGQYPVQIQWEWVVVLADGTQTVGPWSPWTAVSPAQIATIVGTTPTTVALGGNFPLCLSGPIGDRQFSVHFSTTAPVTTFNGPTITVPSPIGSEYCWNSTLPSNWAPQTVTAHLWEIATANYLLYQAQFQLVNASGGHLPPPTGGGGAPWYTGLTAPILFGWVSPLLILLFGVILAVVVGLALRRRSRRARQAATPSLAPPSASGSPFDDET